jgi:hypothetical protein
MIVIIQILFFILVIGVVMYKLHQMRKERFFYNKVMEVGEQMVYVRFNGEQIPMRKEEKWMWDRMDFKAQHANYNQWKDKLKKGIVVKVETQDGIGYVTKEYAEKNNLKIA